MIEFKNVTLTHGKKEILKNLSFGCEKGKITTIIGKNGAGKTGALKCLIGENVYTGEILIDGCDIRKMSPVERAKRVSYLPQVLPDVPFTVYELTALGRKPYLNRIGKMTEEDFKQIERAMHFTDMLAFSQRRINTLSGGEKQRAYLSMILAQNTKAIALDEPATYMDASVERELCALLKKLSREMGKTIVQVMHNLTRAVNDSDDIMILDGGRVICETNAENIKNGTLIEEIFFVKKGVFLSSDGEEQTIYL